MKVPKVVTRFVIKIGDKFLASEDFWNPHSKWSDLKLEPYPWGVPWSLRFDSYEAARSFLMDCYNVHYFLRKMEDKVEIISKNYIKMIGEE